MKLRETTIMLQFKFLPLVNSFCEMGNIIKGKCTDCGFETKFQYGGTKSNFRTVCMMPAIDLRTQEFVNVNYYDLKESTDYTFYCDEKLKGNPMDAGTINNFDLKLNTKNNYCPKCSSFDLHFGVVMFID